MLAVPLKEAKAVDWNTPLRTYLQENYSRDELDKYSSSVQRLSTAREHVANAVGGKDDSIEGFKSYLGMLGQVEPRFPISDSGKLRITFTWFDALKPTKKMQGQSIVFERACVLFNYGAALSHQGMLQDRSDTDGLKKACQLFQQSAGVFAHLRDHIIGQEYTGPVLTDMSPEGLDMLYYLMLAQAQACFYEKAVHDNHKVAVLSKLAAEACNLYEKALEAAKSSALAPTLDKAWASHLEFQYKCFAASSQLQYSRVVHERADQTTKGYGEEVARVSLASDYAAAAAQCGKSHKFPASMLETVYTLQAVIDRALETATENNNKIYMELVPGKSELSHPPGVALAKPIAPKKKLVQAASFSELGESSSKIFAGLLPKVMHEAEALYQSKLSNLVDINRRQVAQASEDIKIRLSEAGLPAAVEAGDMSDGLPPAVWERLHTLVVNRGGIKGLHEAVESNGKLAVKANKFLDEIESKLSEEEGQDMRARATWGAKWNATSSAELSMHMRADIERYRTLIKDGQESDEALAQKIEENLSQMEILTYSKSRLDGMFPTSDDVDSNPEVDELRGELAMMLVTLGANLQETEKLQKELAEEASHDTIGTAMANAPGGAHAVASTKANMRNLVSETMEKYDPLVSKIEAKLFEQPELLSSVLEMNQAFRSMRNQSEAMLKREGVIAEIDRAINIYNDLVLYIVEGEKFYVNLLSRIEQLKITALDHTYVRDMQRKELEAILSTQAATAVTDSPRPSAPSAPAAPAESSATSQSSYPGMNRPGLNRDNSRPIMQPYAVGDTSQASSQPSAPAPAYPVSAPSTPASPPAPAFPTEPVTTTSDRPFGAKMSTMKSMLGDAFSDAQLEGALEGADGDVNRAVNHLLTSTEPTSTPMSRGEGSSSKRSSSKRKSKKRFGVF